MSFWGFVVLLYIVYGLAKICSGEPDSTWRERRAQRRWMEEYMKQKALDASKPSESWADIVARIRQGKP